MDALSSVGRWLSWLGGILTTPGFDSNTTLQVNKYVITKWCGKCKKYSCLAQTEKAQKKQICNNDRGGGDHSDFFF